VEDACEGLDQVKANGQQLSRARARIFGRTSGSQLSSAAAAALMPDPTWRRCDVDDSDDISSDDDDDGDRLGS
jgi:hypothetical protein